MRQFDELVLAEISERRKRGNSSGTDVLSELVSACDETGKPLTDEELRDLFPSLIFGGRDASATAITWALYSIHKHPAVLDRLLDELDRLGNSPDPMSIVALPYLTAVCNECLRIYPTQVVTFPRLVESTIELMGYELNPGIIIRGCVYLTHQREDLYPEPKQFKPERFLEKQFSNYEFLPFGGGTRRCPGEALALFEMKLILATILSRYQLALVDKRVERPKPQGVNYPPASGLKMVMLGQRQQVIRDQQVIRVDEAVRNVSGVTFGGNSEGGGVEFSLRGFDEVPILRDGFRVYGLGENFLGIPEGFTETANLERVEVLKGPASILYGEVQPGGVINQVSKQPLPTPSYEAQFQVGNRSLIRPSLDISGPLNADRSLLYRLNTVYQRGESFRDFNTDIEKFFIAPVVSWKVSDRTLCKPTIRVC